MFLLLLNSKQFWFEESGGGGLAKPNSKALDLTAPTNQTLDLVLNLTYGTLDLTAAWTTQDQSCGATQCPLFCNMLPMENVQSRQLKF